MKNGNNIVKFKKRRKPNRKRKIRKSIRINPIVLILVLLVIGSAYYLHKNHGNIDVADNSEMMDYYEVIYDGIMTYKTDIPVFATIEGDNQELFDIYNKVLIENPDIFWLTGGSTLIPVGNVMNLRTDTRCNISDVPEMYRALEANVNEIVNLTNQNCNSDYDKALFVHDLLVMNCEYDEETYLKYSLDINDSSDMAYSSYGCIVNRKAVCDGYARAYMLIMRRLGIECGYVHGTAVNSLVTGPHAWNYIKLDDQYYMVDVTWDDPIGGDNTKIRRDYFCLSYKEMEKDHTIDVNCEVPSEVIR